MATDEGARVCKPSEKPGVRLEGRVCILVVAISRPAPASATSAFIPQPTSCEAKRYGCLTPTLQQHTRAFNLTPVQVWYSLDHPSFGPNRAHLAWVRTMSPMFRHRLWPRSRSWSSPGPPHIERLRQPLGGVRRPPGRLRRPPSAPWTPWAAQPTPPGGPQKSWRPRCTQECPIVGLLAMTDPRFDQPDLSPE